MKSFGLPDVVVDGVVEQADPPRKLVHTYRFLFSEGHKAEGFTRVTYDIDKVAAGFSRLTVTHELSGAPLMAGMVASKFSEQGAGGWAWILSDMKSLLETGRRCPTDTHGELSSDPPCGRHASPMARVISNNAAPTTITPIACAVCSPAGASRSMVMAAVTTAIAPRFMTPAASRITIRSAQQGPQRSPKLYAMSQRRFGARRQCNARGGLITAADKLTPFPGRELQCTRDQNDDPDRQRHTARERGLLHRDRRKRDT